MHIQEIKYVSSSYQFYILYVCSFSMEFFKILSWVHYTHTSNCIAYSSYPWKLPVFFFHHEKLHHKKNCHHKNKKFMIFYNHNVSVFIVNIKCWSCCKQRLTSEIVQNMINQALFGILQKKKQSSFLRYEVVTVSLDSLVIRFYVRMCPSLNSIYLSVLVQVSKKEVCYY